MNFVRPLIVTRRSPLARIPRRPGWLVVMLLSVAALGEATAATSDESFVYPLGTSVGGQSGGSGWNGAWTAQNGNGFLIVEDGSLTYPGIVSTGGKMHFTGIPATGTSTNSFRVLATPLTEGTTHYVRVLAQNLNDGLRFFGVALFEGTTERTLVGQASTSPNWTINHVDGFPELNNTLNSGIDSSSLALLVLKLELLAGVERVTFWVNPDLSQRESEATAIGGTSYFTDNDYGQVTRIRIGAGGFSASAGGDPTDHYLDEISISPTSPFFDPFAIWIAGFSIADAAQRTKEADPDRDGLVNAQEFYLDTNPLIHNRIQPTRVGNNMRVAFKRRDDAEYLSVELETSATLSTGSWVPIEDSVNGVDVNVTENGNAPDDVEVLIPTGASGRNFARFKLTLN
jgi:hypothetical protein